MLDGTSPFDGLFLPSRIRLARRASGYDASELGRQDDLDEQRPTTEAASATDPTTSSDRLARLATLILDAAADGIFGLDVDGDATFVNPAAERMLGWDTVDLIGRHLHDTIHYAHPDGSPYPVAECPAYATLTDGRRRTVDTEVFWTKDGRSFPVEYTSTPILENEVIAGAVITFRDISDRQRSVRLAEVEEKNALIQLLQTVAVASNEAETTGEALRRAIEQVCEHTGWPVGHAYLMHEEAEAAASAGVWHSADPKRFERLRAASARTDFRPGEGLVGKVLLTGEPVCVADLAQEPAFTRGRAEPNTGVAAAFLFPLLIGREVVGVLEFFSDEISELNEPLLETMVHVGTQLGRTVERERVSRQLERLALKDDLTGLHNRRGFVALAQQQLQTARRRKAGMTLLYLDLNDLKPINDRFGHAEGDRALKVVGELLAGTFRASDVTGRVGGDEFCVLLTDGDVRDHAMALVRLEDAIERRNRDLHPWKISISAGHAAFDPERPEGVEELIRAADQSMYMQKRSGKQRGG
jgi:diguanylate cyclase (GGDEF)-like protein/PAS domain S-box-containing protein